jgi:vitamin B12 transporter
MVDNSESQPQSLVFSLDKKRNKQAIFANDSIALGQFTVAPGVRYDRISNNNAITSPSLGITYSLAPDTLLRAYAARGFEAPSFSNEFGEAEVRPNPDIKNEKIESVQAGIESTVVPSLWLKASVFRHSIWDAFADETLSDGSIMVVNAARERIQGIELEAKSSPVFHTTFGAGIMVLSAKDQDTGAKIPFRPSETYTVQAKYADGKSLHVLLTGRYSKWNPPDSAVEPGTDSASKNAAIWDIHASKSVRKSAGKTSWELFFSMRNLFNGKEYLNFTQSLAAPTRWAEGGIRVIF